MNLHSLHAPELGEVGAGLVDSKNAEGEEARQGNTAAWLVLKWDVLLAHKGVLKEAGREKGCLGLFRSPRSLSSMATAIRHVLLFESDCWLCQEHCRVRAAS